MRLGRVLYAYGQNQAAAACFERCQRLEPQEFEWSYLLAVARSDLGQTDAALLAFEAAAAVRPERSPDCHSPCGFAGVVGGALRSRRYPPAGAPTRARKRCGAPTDSGGWLRWKRTVARSSTSKRRLPSMRTIGRRFTHLPRNCGWPAAKPKRRRSWSGMGPWHLLPRRHYEDPLVDAMDSVRSASAQQVFNDARALQDGGDLEGALASYGSVLEIDPNHAQAHVNLIVVNGQLQRHEDVARHYERAVELNPSIAEAHYNYGVSRHLGGRLPRRGSCVPEGPFDQSARRKRAQQLGYRP